jgi:hypothetical protein
MFTAVVGHNEDLDGVAAATEVLTQCRQQLNGTVPTAARGS